MHLYAVFPNISIVNLALLPIDYKLEKINKRNNFWIYSNTKEGKKKLVSWWYPSFFVFFLIRDVFSAYDLSCLTQYICIFVGHTHLKINIRLMYFSWERCIIVFLKLLTDGQTNEQSNDQVPKQELSSLYEKLEIVVWISVACVVILIIILCFTVAVFKRTYVHV